MSLRDSTTELFFFLQYSSISIHLVIILSIIFNGILIIYLVLQQRTWFVLISTRILVWCDSTHENPCKKWRIHTDVKIIPKWNFHHIILRYFILSWRSFKCYFYDLILPVYFILILKRCKNAIFTSWYFGNTSY